MLLRLIVAVLLIVSFVKVSADTLPVTDELQLHLEAGDINNDNGASNPVNGANVASWTSLEGRALVFDQTGGATVQPTYTASEATINNKPTVTFSGQAGEWLAFGDGTTDVINGAATTFFVVARFTSNDDDYNGLMAGWHTGINYGDYQQYEGFCINDRPDASDGVDMTYHAVGNDSSKVSPDNVTDWMLLEVHCDGTNIRVFQLGELREQLPQLGRSFDFEYLYLGARHDSNDGSSISGDKPHACQIAEVIMYEKALSDIERNSIGSHLQTKYGFSGNYQAANLSALTVNDATNAANWSLQGNLQSGDLVYGDRTYTFNSVPDSIRGCDWIRPANDSKESAADPLFSVTVATDSVVYVAWNDLVTPQTWLTDDWTSTGEGVTINGAAATYTVYKRIVSAGTVEFGPNGNTLKGLYIPVIRPLDASSLVVDDPTNAADWSLQSDLQSGDLIYGDRTYTFNSVPDYLLGCDWIRPANDSKDSSSNPLVTFNVRTESVVYIALNNGVTPQSWLTASWTDTGDDLTMNGHADTYSVYKRTVSPGSIDLGPNNNSTKGIYVPIIKPLSFSDLSVDDPANVTDWSVQSDLQVGDLTYGDRTYTFDTVPEYLLGCDWIRPANDSKGSSSDPLVTFSVPTDTLVYILWNDQVTPQSWLTAEWSDTGEEVIINGTATPYSIYKRTVSAGTVLLGPNGNTLRGLYIPVIKSLDLSTLVVKDTNEYHYWSLQGHAQVGDKVYGDRTYTFATLPDELIGVDWIRPANDSKNSSENPLATFRVDQTSVVYVAWNQSVSTQSWLSDDWTTTGEVITLGGASDTHEVYRRFVSPGEVSIGPNGNSSKGIYMTFVKNYSVFAVEDSYSVVGGNTLSVPATGVLANDQGTISSLVVKTAPQYAASFTLNNDGSFDYTPVANFYGKDSFIYTISDGTNSADGVVTITVTGGLMAHWTLDESSGTGASDSTPAGLDGTIAGTAVWAPTVGAVNGSLVFDGVDDMVSVGDIGMPAKTITMWVNFPVEVNKDITTQALVGYAELSDYIGIGHVTGDFSDEVLTVLGTVGSNNYRTASKSNISAGWRHLAFSWNGSYYRIYVDAVEQTVFAGTRGHTPLLDFSNFSIGARSNGTHFFTGSMDDVRLYEDALSPAEITALFTAGNPPTPAYGVEVTYDGVNLSWSVDYEDGVVSYRVEQLIDGSWRSVTTVAATGELGAEYSVVVGEGTFRIVAVDASGFSQSFAVSGSDTQFISLKKGWNLISLPCDIDDTSLELLKQVSATLWGWDGNRYMQLDKPEPLQGFWIYSELETELTVNGKMVSDGTVELSPGWNLYGPAENCKVPSNLIIFSWEKIYKQILETSNGLIRGRGYWFYSDSAIELKLGK